MKAQSNSTHQSRGYLLRLSCPDPQYAPLPRTNSCNTSDSQFTEDLLRQPGIASLDLIPSLVRKGVE